MAANPGEVSPRWAAKRLGVSVYTIWRKCRDGQYVRRRDASGRYWLRKHEIEQLAEEFDHYGISEAD